MRLLVIILLTISASAVYHPAFGQQTTEEEFNPLEEFDWMKWTKDDWKKEVERHAEKAEDKAKDAHKKALAFAKEQNIDVEEIEKALDKLEEKFKKGGLIDQDNAQKTHRCLLL